MTGFSQLKLANKIKIILICSTWLRYAAYIFIGDYALMLGSLRFLNVPIYYYLIQAIIGSIYGILMIVSMIKSFKLRIKTYLFLYSLLQNNKPIKYSLLYNMSQIGCDKALIKSLEKEFNIKLI